MIKKTAAPVQRTSENGKQKSSFKAHILEISEGERAEITPRQPYASVEAFYSHLPSEFSRIPAQQKKNGNYKLYFCYLAFKLFIFF